MALATSSTAVLLLAFVTSALYLLSKIWKIGTRPADIPPGPPTIPILGNLHQLPIDKPHVQLQKWAQQYGYEHKFAVVTR